MCSESDNGKNYTDYKKSLEILDIETLESRRDNLCKKMAIKQLKYQV